LLWGRDLLQRGKRGHVDVPRLIEGNVALTVFGVATKSPRHLNIERNDDRSDDITLLAIGRGWPAKTLRSLNARALHLGRQLEATANRSNGTLTLVRSGADLEAFLARRADNPGLVAGLLAIEGAHALGPGPGRPRRDRRGRVPDGRARPFLRQRGRGIGARPREGRPDGAGSGARAELEGRQIIVDLAHSSRATIDDVLALAQRPVVASHTGVCGVADNARNLPDEQLRGIAATGGIVGIGFWPTACGGEDAAAIARRSSTPRASPASTTSGSGRTSTAASPSRSTRPAWR
jgi:hypothetical protein